MSRGTFITFEGTEGCGKTTQAHKLAQYLRSVGRRVVLTREPGGTRLGGHIRELILSPENRELCLEAEALLYAADRAQHLKETVVPALESGTDVVCDRYVDSSIAYQGAAGGLGVEWVRHINELATAGLLPDLTFWLDCASELGLGRRGRSGVGLDRIEQRDIEYHERVREGFAAIAQAEPGRVIRVDISSLGVAQVREIVIGSLLKKLPHLAREGK